MNKNKLMYILMIVMFLLPLIVFFPAFLSFFIFWEENFNEPLFEAFYNLTFITAFAVAVTEFISAICGIILGVTSYTKGEIERFPVVRVIYYIIGSLIFSSETFILSFLTVHVFTYGMGV